MQRKIILAPLLLAVWLAAPLAEAAPVTVIAQGTQSGFSDPDGLLPFADSGNGASWSLTLTYESDTVDDFIYYSTFPGIYTGAITSMSLTINGQSFNKLESGTVLIANDAQTDAGDAYVDQWTAYTGTGTDLGEYDSVLGEFTLWESFGIFAESIDTAPPVGPLDSKLLNPIPELGLWDGAYLIYSFNLLDKATHERTWLATAEATITSVSVIPIPATVWLFLSGLLSLFGARAARKISA